MRFFAEITHYKKETSQKYVMQLVLPFGLLHLVGVASYIKMRIFPQRFSPHGEFNFN